MSLVEHSLEQLGNSFVELQDNSVKTENSETFNEEIRTGCEGLNEITIKPEPLLDHEVYDKVIKTENNGELIFTCIQCSEFFKHIELYELHIALHNQTNVKIKHCPCCKRTYQRMDSYTLHIQEHLRKFYGCTFCNQIFFNQNILKQHIFKHKLNGALACPYCEKKFQLQKSLTTHIRVHTNERPYECEICSNRFKQLSSLRTHKELIHYKDNPQECEICHGKFCTKSSLIRHMKLHKTGRTITCKACKLNFLNKDLYKEHRMERHAKLSSFFEICPHCNEEFFTYREYYYHTKVHVSSGKMKENKKKFRFNLDVIAETKKLSSIENTEVCWVCGATVSSQMYGEHKNEHMLMTSEELSECAQSKQFPCKRCDTICSSKKNLLNHVGSHMEKVYVCKEGGCPQYVYTYNGLKRHERRCHALSKAPSKSRSCFLCGLQVLTVDYDRHLNAHAEITDEEILQYHSAQEYPCKQCNLILTKRSALLKHTMSHMPKTYTCQKCDGNLYSYAGLSSHERKVHDEYACKRCNRTFMGFKKFQTHHHKGDYTRNKLRKKIFKCLWCSAKFSNPMAITHHYKSHKSYDFRCRICNRRYPIARDIKDHMIRVHKQRFSTEDCYRYLVNKVDPTEEAFVCALCKVGFSTKNALNKHALIHRDNRHQCEKCKTCFTDFGRYASHVKNNVCMRWMVEGLIPEAKDLACNFCNELFSEYFKITKHITIMHLEEPYQCKFCVSYHPVKSFRRHLIKRHPRRKKYLCVGCKASFVTFKVYLQHRKSCVQCPLIHRDRWRRQEHHNESNIVINDDAFQEDIIDIPEKVVVNEFGEVVVPENGEVSAFSGMDVDYLETIG